MPQIRKPILEKSKHLIPRACSASLPFIEVASSLSNFQKRRDARERREGGTRNIESIVDGLTSRHIYSVHVGDRFKSASGMH